ncbi:MAG: glycosyltransferase [Solirubrobacteraceae bacterium]
MPIDVLMVSLGTTAGLRAMEQQLAGSLRRAGASVAVARAHPVARVRTFALTDLLQARAAARAARRAVADCRPRAVLYSSSTAALLWPRPGAIHFDAPAAGNRPGRHGIWQRPVERRRFAEAPLVAAWSPGGLAEAPRHREGLVVPFPVEPSGPPAGDRDVAAVTYAADPEKKGLDRVLDAWRRARRPGERLVVTGRGSGPSLDGVEWAGLVSAADFRALLRRSRLFLTAPRREDYGISQLEALADGCLLVTVPAPGPYAALAVARELDPRLVADDLAPALRAALDDPVAGYAERAAEALAPYRREQIDAAVAERLLPRLLATA